MASNKPQPRVEKLSDGAPILIDFIEGKLRTFLALATVLFLPLLCVNQAIAAETIYELEFKSNVNGLRVTTVQTLTREDEGFLQLKSHTSNFFASLTELSQFTIEDGQIIPIKHKFDRNIFGSKRNEESNFDWELGQATWEGKGRTESNNVSVGIFDRASYQLQIRNDLRDEKNELSYQLFDRGRIKEYSFTVSEPEMIETGAGSFEAIKVTRIKDEPDDASTSLWFAPALDYQLIRLEHIEDDGANYEMVLEEIVSSAEPSMAASSET